jgi:hypothetical protein
MTEIFEDISEEIRQLAKHAWENTLAQNNPIKAAEFLSNITNYYSNILSEREMEFLQFYFQTQMEMMKK